jgi:hypothetical protein
MILPFSRLRVADSQRIKMNPGQLGRLRAMAGMARGKSDYLRGTGVGVWPFWLKPAVSLVTLHRRDKSHRANAWILVADAIVQWMISGEGEEEELKCN